MIFLGSSNYITEIQFRHNFFVHEYLAMKSFKEISSYP